MGALVSIITPVYNCERYIGRCIESLLNQHYKEIEIIMIDDGSIDQSAKIIKEYQKREENIRYIYQENSGPGVARNKGIKIANGKYILFVDSDDYISHSYIEDLVKNAEMYNSEMIIGGYTMVYESNKKDMSVFPAKYQKEISEEWAYRISACCSRLYLKEFWERHELSFSREKGARAEDVPIALYSNVMAKNISVVQNAGYYYYQHPESAMNSKNKKVLFGFPYVSFEEMYEKLATRKKENSELFFQIGVLKFLTQFDLVIYRKAEKEEKDKFKKYLRKVIGKDFPQMVCSWRQLKYRLDLPVIYKLAIDIFIMKYNKLQGE